MAKYSTSTIKITPEQKIAAVAARSAILNAKYDNDPAYERYKKHRELAKEARDEIMKKWYEKSKKIIEKRMKGKN